MKGLIIAIVFSLIAVLQPGIEMQALSQENHIVPPGPNDVHIGPNVVVIPLGRMLLVRKDTQYCAIKFTEFWTGKTKEDVHARYESYYQGDASGDFARKNVQIKKEELSFPKPRGIGRFAFSFGNKNIQCGPIKLFWSGKGSVYFQSDSQPEADYGVELSPTKWTDISQVNVFDSRLKW
jgi:hypothetical protein